MHGRTAVTAIVVVLTTVASFSSSAAGRDAGKAVFTCPALDALDEIEEARPWNPDLEERPYRGPRWIKEKSRVAAKPPSGAIPTRFLEAVMYELDKDGAQFDGARLVMCKYAFKNADHDDYTLQIGIYDDRSIDVSWNPAWEKGEPFMVDEDSPEPDVQVVPYTCTAGLLEKCSYVLIEHGAD